MKWLSKKKIRKWLRLIHRDLGFFLIGVTIVYSVSGIILNHKKQGDDPAYKTILIQESWPSSFTVSQFKTEFAKSYNTYEINKVLPEERGYQLFLKGGLGFYNVESGELWFEIYKKKPIVFFLNKLHYNQKQHWTAPADIFAGGLIFLALSGLLMVRGKNGLKGSGKWYALLGLVSVLIYIWL